MSKITKTRAEFTGLKIQELVEKVDTLRRDLFVLQLNAPTTHVKDYSQYKKLRKDIARALTILRQKVAHEIVSNAISNFIQERGNQS